MAREFVIGDDDHPLFIGEDKFIDIALENDTGGPLTVPGGWTFEWVLRKNASATAVIVSKTTGAGQITVIDTILGPQTGARVEIDDTDTVSLEPEIYYHTLRRSNAGAKTVLSYGPVILRYAATR